MVSQIIGNYLVRSGVMTRGQWMIIQKEQRRVRAGLGLIAIAEGLMMPSDVKEIYNELLEKGLLNERAFADKVVADGYLTEEQVRSLAAKQSDSYLCLVQALAQHNIIDMEKLEDILRESDLVADEFQLEDLKSNDINRIVPIFIPPEAEKYLNAATAAMRFLNQKVDANIYPAKAFITEEFSAANGVIQLAEGEKEFFVALAAGGRELADVATCYTRERYDEDNDEIFDVIGEILGGISKAYATVLGQNDVLIDLTPPRVCPAPQTLRAAEMLVLPLNVKNATFYLVISMEKAALF